MLRYSSIGLMTMLLLACASNLELDTSGVNTALTAASASEHPDTAQAQRVLWGGVILASHNLAQHTELEVLAYATDSNGEPRMDSTPRGRFLVRHPGYLETADYAQGRRLTVLGSISASHKQKVGEAEYRYAVITPERLHLWPLTPRTVNQPRWHFGFGFVFH